jgi:hypothetical protein
MPSDGKSSHCLWQGELKDVSLHGYLFKSYIYFIQKNNKKQAKKFILSTFPHLSYLLL